MSKERTGPRQDNTTTGAEAARRPVDQNRFAPDASERERAAAQAREIKSMRDRFLLATFGFMDTDRSFYVLPPASATKVVYWMLENAEQARAVYARIGSLDYTLLSANTIAVRVGDSEAVRSIIERGVARGAITLVYEGAFDPRGTNIDSWTRDELARFVIEEKLVNESRASGMNRESLEAKVHEYYFGVDSEGAEMADDTDHLGVELLEIYDRLVSARAITGRGLAKKELVNALKPYREDFFATGRKSRIIQLRKLAKTCMLDEQDRAGVVERLRAATEALESDERDD